MIKIESTWRRELTLLYCDRTVRSSHWRCSIEKVVFKNSAIPTGNNCAGVFFLKVAGLKAPTQVFSCEYCEIFKNIYFEKHLRTAAFDCFNSSLPHEPKVSRSRLYDGLKLQGLQVFSGSSGRHLTSWTEFRPAFEKSKTNIFDESMKILDWLFLVGFDGFMSF